MKKRLTIMLLTLCLLLTVTPAVAAAEAAEETQPVRAANECGEGITWDYTGTVLTISGDGKMDDFETAPWAQYKDEMTEVIIAGDLTYIGAKAFRDHDALETVDFGDALYEIGAEAFVSCDALVSIELPKSFRIFGEASFMSCKNLKEIHCAGRFPSFKQNCLWDTYVTIYYPVESPWGVEYIQQLEEAFKGRVEFLAEDGSDHYTPTEPIAEPEETEPEITEPVTEPPVVTLPPATEPPVTEAPTEPPATETETEPTEDPTEQTLPEEPDADSGLDSISVGLIIVAAVLGLTVLGALVFSGKFGRKGRFSK